MVTLRFHEAGWAAGEKFRGSERAEKHDQPDGFPRTEAAASRKKLRRPLAVRLKETWSRDALAAVPAIS
jgi:hypothetical protein